MKIRRPLHARQVQRISGPVAATLTVLLLGCSSAAVVRFGESGDKQRQAIELESLLDRYTRDFSETVERAADEIVDSAPDLETRRATVRWKLKSIPRVKELKRSHARQGEALLALWLFTEWMLRHYEDGPGAGAFGAGQPVAIAACRKLEGKIESVARTVLDGDDGFETARQVVEEYAERHATSQRDGGVTDYGSVDAGILELTADTAALEWLPSFSLEAFNPFRGLNESATAIRHFTERTNATIEDVYTELPWRVELLLYDIERRDTVQETRANLDRVSESAASLARTADRLPADMKEVFKASLDEIDAKQEGLRLTLRRAEEALMQAEGVVSGLSQTAASLTEAGNAWDATFQTLGLGDGRETSESSKAERTGRPFDILEYRDTAEELRSVAVELRGLVRDVHALTDSRDADAPLRNIELAAQTAAAAAIGQGRDLVDHAALRLLQLVAAVLVAAILYRVVVSRLALRPPMSGSRRGHSEAD